MTEADAIIKEFVECKRLKEERDRILKSHMQMAVRREGNAFERVSRMKELEREYNTRQPAAWEAAFKYVEEMEQ